MATRHKVKHFHRHTVYHTAHKDIKALEVHLCIYIVCVCVCNKHMCIAERLNSSSMTLQEAMQRNKRLQDHFTGDCQQKEGQQQQC